MGRSEWAMGNSGEICAYCHKPITEICGCGSNDLKFKHLIKTVADYQIENKALQAQLSAQEKELEAAKELIISVRGASKLLEGYWGLDNYYAHLGSDILKKALAEYDKLKEAQDAGS